MLRTSMILSRADGLLWLRPGAWYTDAVGPPTALMAPASRLTKPKPVRREAEDRDTKCARPSGFVAPPSVGRSSGRVPGRGHQSISATDG